MAPTWETARGRAEGRREGEGRGRRGERRSGREEGTEEVGKERRREGRREGGRERRKGKKRGHVRVQCNQLYTAHMYTHGGWLSPGGHSSGDRALTAKVRGPRFNPGWLPKFLPKPFHHAHIPSGPCCFLTTILTLLVSVMCALGTAEPRMNVSVPALTNGENLGRSGRERERERDRQTDRVKEMGENSNTHVHVHVCIHLYTCTPVHVRYVIPCSSLLHSSMHMYT